MSKVDKLSASLRTSVERDLYNKLKGEVVPAIQRKIMDVYDEKLVDIVTDRKSKTNPNLYRDDFMERIEKFEYLKKTGDSISIIIPNMESFDFSGRLKVIESIMEGTAGKFVEINEEEYVSIFGKKPINQEPIDEYVPPKERVYIVRYNSKVRQTEKNLRKRFTEYPFSNTPPIDIFGQVKDYVNANMKEWVYDAISKSSKNFANRTKGVRL